jgi:hypothetical protein
MDVDDFVLRNLTDQITSYQNVLDSMHIKLASYDDAEREEVERAAAVLRKVRAGSGRIQLSITPLHPGQPHDHQARRGCDGTNPGSEASSGATKVTPERQPHQTRQSQRSADLNADDR